MARHGVSGALMQLKGNQGGVVLVLVLWTLVLLATIAGAMTMTQRTSVSMTANMRQDLEARASLEAGVEFMIYQTQKTSIKKLDDEIMEWKADGLLRSWTYLGRTVRVAATPEVARIDLNLAQEAILKQLMENVGVDEEEALSLVAAILDWRDVDSNHRLNGAEDSDYEAAGLSYGAKDAKFDTVDELRMVLGVTESLYNTIAPALTVFSGQRTVNPVYASEQVLAAIPGMDEASVANYLTLRAEHQALGDVVPLPAEGQKQFMSSQVVSIYRVYADTKLDSGQDIKVMVVASVGSATSGRAYSQLLRSYSPSYTPAVAINLETEDLE